MKKTFLILFVITIIASILRFYDLTKNPPGYYWDEVAIGYNAYSINQTGKDEWGAKFPLLFRSFNDYKAPLYIYAVAFSQKFLGPTDLSIRLPSAIAGILSVPVLFFLTLELLKSSKIALTTSFLLATSSWHLQFSRIGFEGALALLLVLCGLLFFLLAIRKNIYLLIPSLLFFALSIMAYHAEKIFTPLFLASLFFFFKKALFEKPRKKLIIVILIGTIFFLPYLPTYFSSEGRVRLTQESIFGQKEPANILFIKNYLSNFSLDYLFFRGDQNGRHSVKKLGELFGWQLPFVLVGLWVLVKNRNKSSAIIFAWLLLAAIPVALVRPAPHAYRNFISVAAWEMVCAVGIWKLIKNYKTAFIIFVIAVYSFAVYLDHYYFHAKKAYAADWMDGNKEAVLYLKSVEKNYDRILVYKDLPPIYILFYGPYDPAKLHFSNHNLDHLGKYQYFHKFDLQRGQSKERTLVIVPSWAISSSDNILREIRMNNGDPLYRIYEL